MDCNTPGFPVLHCLPEFAQTHVHWVGEAIQPSHPLSSPSPPTLNLSQQQGLFQWVSSLHWIHQSIGASVSASVLSMNIQGWYPLGLTGLISLQSKGLSRVFSSTTNRKYQFFSAQPLYGPTLTSVHDDGIALAIQIFVSKAMSLLLNMLSKFVIAFLPRSKCLLISWLQSSSAIILEPKKINSATVFTISPSICRKVMGSGAMILVFWKFNFSVLHTGLSLPSF